MKWDYKQHIYTESYIKNKMKLQFEKTQIKVRTNKLLNAIERERERERERQNCSMALSQIGSDLAKPLTSFLVRVSKSPLRNDMALLISVFLVLCTTLVIYVCVFWDWEIYIWAGLRRQVQKHVWAGLKINKIVFFFLG